MKNQTKENKKLSTKEYKEAKQLHHLINVVDCFSTTDLIRYEDLYALMNDEQREGLS